jgi:hypothetical protein
MYKNRVMIAEKKFKENARYKNTLTERKNAFNGFIRRLHTAKEKISRLR